MLSITTQGPLLTHLTKDDLEVIDRFQAFPNLFRKRFFEKGFWEVFAPAASRRTCLHVSEGISGLPLSRPVRIIGLSGRYPDNNLIRRSPILEHPEGPFTIGTFQYPKAMGY